MKISMVAKILLSRHAQREKNEKPYSDYVDILQSKDDVLHRFQSDFAPNAIDDLSASTFNDFLSYKHNRHWTGLQRATSHVCDDMPRLRLALKHLFDESIPVSDRIDSLVRDEAIAVPGINIGILTPLLLVRFPEKYGVWNGKAESAMKTMKLWPKFPRGSTKGEKYTILNSLFLQLSDATSLDLWSLDGLWHVINESCQHEVEQELEEENEEQKDFYEGKKKPTSGFAYERDPKARTECINHNGADCVVCGFNFLEFYGELGLKFIHVHHVTDVAIRGETTINPKKDLVPVCPNCHAMLHRRSKPARSVEELRKIIATCRAEANET